MNTLDKLEEAREVMTPWTSLHLPPLKSRLHHQKRNCTATELLLPRDLLVLGMDKYMSECCNIVSLQPYQGCFFR